MIHCCWILGSFLNISRKKNQIVATSPTHPHHFTMPRNHLILLHKYASPPIAAQAAIFVSVLRKLLRKENTSFPARNTHTAIRLNTFNRKFDNSSGIWTEDPLCIAASYNSLVKYPAKPTPPFLYKILINFK